MEKIYGSDFEKPDKNLKGRVPLPSIKNLKFAFITYQMKLIVKKISNK